MTVINITTPKCRCRKPKQHRDCAYCGYGGDGIHICGQCYSEGIDGPVIKGTSRVVCAYHKKHYH